MHLNTGMGTESLNDEHLTTLTIHMPSYFDSELIFPADSSAVIRSLNFPFSITKNETKKQLLFFIFNIVALLQLVAFLCKVKGGL